MSQPVLYNTFGLPSACDRLLNVDSEVSLRQLLAEGELRHGPFFILGGGSNVILPVHYAGTILHLATRGVRSVKDPEDASQWLVTAAAGEKWSDFVITCSQNGWYGLENLAAIPGTVGASPVQNVGAYGLEAKDVIHSVLTYEVATCQPRVFTNEECHFGYRDSIFKHEVSGHYVVVEVTFRLSSVFSPNLSYKALEEAVRQAGVSAEALTSQQLIDVITALRWSKLPLPEELGSVGSFFKNPMVAESHLAQLRMQYPDIPAYPASVGEGDEPLSKVPAAWLIEHAGWKGRRLGPVGVYDKQALVLVNHGGATAADVRRLADAIIADVASRYGVTLTPEAVFLGEQ